MSWGVPQEAFLGLESWIDLFGFAVFFLFFSCDSSSIPRVVTHWLTDGLTGTKLGQKQFSSNLTTIDDYYILELQTIINNIIIVKNLKHFKKDVSICRYRINTVQYRQIGIKVSIQYRRIGIKVSIRYRQIDTSLSNLKNLRQGGDNLNIFHKFSEYRSDSELLQY